MKISFDSIVFNNFQYMKGKTMRICFFKWIGNLTPYFRRFIAIGRNHDDLLSFLLFTSISIYIFILAIFKLVISSHWNILFLCVRVLCFITKIFIAISKVNITFSCIKIMKASTKIFKISWFNLFLPFVLNFPFEQMTL